MNSALKTADHTARDVAVYRACALAKQTGEVMVVTKTYRGDTAFLRDAAAYGEGRANRFVWGVERAADIPKLPNGKFAPEGFEIECVCEKYRDSTSGRKPTESMVEVRSNNGRSETVCL